jgi:hypothetical protein
MNNTIDWQQAGCISVAENGRSPLPVDFRDEWIDELRRKRTLWSCFA